MADTHQSLISALKKEDDLNRAQRDKHLRLLLEDAREARQQEAAAMASARDQEAALRREEAAQTAAFNQAFLGVLGDIARSMNNRYATSF